MTGCKLVRNCILWRGGGKKNRTHTDLVPYALDVLHLRILLSYLHLSSFMQIKKKDLLSVLAFQHCYSLPIEKQNKTLS